MQNGHLPTCKGCAAGVDHLCGNTPKRLGRKTPVPRASEPAEEVVLKEPVREKVFDLGHFRVTFEGMTEVVDAVSAFEAAELAAANLPTDVHWPVDLNVGDKIFRVYRRYAFFAVQVGG